MPTRIEREVERFVKANGLEGHVLMTGTDEGTTLWVAIRRLVDQCCLYHTLYHFHDDNGAVALIDSFCAESKLIDRVVELKILVHRCMVLFDGERRSDMEKVRRLNREAAEAGCVLQPKPSVPTGEGDTFDFDVIRDALIQRDGETNIAYERRRREWFLTAAARLMSCDPNLALHVGHHVLLGQALVPAPKPCEEKGDES